MNLDRQIRVQSDAMTRMRDAYMAASTYTEPHARIIERMTTILNDLPKGTPRHIRTYLQGYWHALSDQYMTRDTIFGAWIDGEFYCHERGNPESVDARGISYSDFSALLTEHQVDQHFYWRSNTARPY